MAANARRRDRLDERELGAWRGFLRTHRDLVAHLDAELQRELGLPLNSYEVLMYLADAPGERLRMGELAGELLLSRSGLTRLVDRLERQGLVRRERCEDDARGYFATLEPAGRKLLARARPAHLAGVREHFLDRLVGEEPEALARIWARFESTPEADPDDEALQAGSAAGSPNS